MEGEILDGLLQERTEIKRPRTRVLSELLSIVGIDGNPGLDDAPDPLL